MDDPIESIRPLVPRIEQFLGYWAIEEKNGHDLAAYVRSMDLVAHVQAARASGRDAEAAGPGYQVVDGVAVIELRGTMTKYAQSLSNYPGSVVLQRRVRQAAADRDVRSILLVVESPGGTVAGTGDLADAVYAAAAKKPVVTYGEDLMASAAYEVGSQASRVIINNDAVVGSIGTYAVLYDWSALFAREGVKAVVIRAGEFKGMGTVGTEITAEQRAEFQRTITAINREFLARVARGRRLSAERVAALATGGVEVGRDAVAVGLADEIGTYDAAVTIARRMGDSGVRPTRQTSPVQERTMSNDKPEVQEKPPAPTAASIQELKQEFPDSTAEWRESCVEQGLTMTQATKAWARHQSEALKQTQKELAALQAAQAQAQADAEAAGKKPGQPALKDGGGQSGQAEDGSATERFNAAVEAKMAAGLPKPRAISAVVKEQPDLHRAYLREHNQRFGRKPLYCGEEL